MSDIRDLIEATIRRVTKRQKYYGHYRYRVQEDMGPTVRTSRPDLVPVREELDLPTLPVTNKVFGAAGLYSKMKAGTEVLVGFEGGDSAFPYVAAVLPSSAIDVELSVSGKVKVVGESPVNAAQSVALYQAFRTYIDTVETYLLACDTALNGLTGGALTPLIAARKAAALNLDQSRSSKLEAE